MIKLQFKCNLKSKSTGNPTKGLQPIIVNSDIIDLD